MRILMLLDNEFPPDERVEKEIRSLTEAGHKLSIACITLSAKPEFEQTLNLNIYRLPLKKYAHKFSAACLVFPFYFNIWTKFVTSILKKESFDCLHVHDLPLSSVALKFKKKFGIKVVCDQHEYYSDWIIHTAHYNTFVGKIVNKLSNWDKYEYKCLHKADKVVTVAEPLRDCYIGKHGIAGDKIIVVPNTPHSSTFKNESIIQQQILDKYKDKYVLLYTGGIDILRGLDLPMKALPEISKKIPNVLFLIVGKIGDTYDPRNEAEQLGVSDYVECVGWQPLTMLPSYTKAAKITVFTPPATRDDINNTITTKIYQYISAGKPVAMSSARMMREFLVNNNAGFSVNDDDYQAFAKWVIKLYESPELYNQMSTNALKLSDAYTWENTVKDLVAYYQTIDKPLN